MHRSRLPISWKNWFRDGAADGFNLMPPVLPAMLEMFIAEVVPLLQRRGLFRSEYAGETLRGLYGLRRPDLRFQAGADEMLKAGAST